MEETRKRERRDAWDRFGWLWPTLFYGALLFSVALGLWEGEMPPGEWGIGITLIVFLAGWQAILVWLGPRRLWTNPRLGLPLILLGILAWYPLAQMNDAFYFLLAGLFPTVYSNLKISLSIALTLLITTLIVLHQAEGAVTLRNPIVWIYAGSMGLAILVGVWLNAIIEQSARRRLLIEQLEATQEQLAAAERREGVMQERERLAREIHDTLSQGFTSIVMHLEAAEQALPDDMDTLRRHLDRARDTARQSLRQAREVVQDLRPDLLARQSLPEALERVTVKWSEENGIAVTMTTTGTVVPLPAGIDVTLLRVLQEALANARKHAQATAVTVTLSYMGDVVVLDVQDNGMGLDGASPSPFRGGFGLTAMRERVEQLGGKMLVESEPREGTTLVIEMPIVGGEA